MNTATMSGRGRVTIPKHLRDRLGLRKATRVQFVECGGVLALVPLPDGPVEALRGMLAGGPPLTAELIAEHGQERG